jgi:hypothetical protein
MNEENEILVNISDHKIDEFEAKMARYKPVECPLNHERTPGLYTREILMPALTFVSSMIHKTEHPFFVLQGKVAVWSENDGYQLIEAPYRGITKPGTRRVLLTYEDTVWVTVHACDDSETVDDIEERIIEKHDNPLLSKRMKKIFYNLHRFGLAEKNKQIN